MSLTFLNTALKPAYEVLLDASLTGDSFSMNLGRRSGWYKYGIDGPDGSIYTGTTTINMTFPDASNRNLRVWKGGTSGPSGINTIVIYNEDIESLDVTRLDSLNSINISVVPTLKTLKIGECKDDALQSGFSVYQTDISVLDVSSLKNVGISFFVRDNASLKTLVLPNELSGNSTLDSLDIYDNDVLDGTLDLSIFKYFNEDADIRLYNNNLDGVIFPDISTKIDRLQMNNNNISGNVDLSPLKGLYGYVYMDRNSIETITWPETSANFTQISVYDCDLSILDLTNLTGGIERLTFMQNYSSLNEIKLPDSSVPFSNFSFGRNYNITTLDVSNRIFKDCNFNGDYCTNLQKILFPDASCSFTSFFLQSGDLQGVLDVSNHYFSGSIIIYNHDITKFLIDMGKCSNLSSFSLRNCANLTGGYDLSTFTTLNTLNVENTDIGYVIPPADCESLYYNIGGSLCASNGIVDLSSVKSINHFDVRNTDASVIYWPYDASSQELSHFRIDGCNFSGVIDISLFPSISQDIEIYDNPNVTGLILPDSSSSYQYGGAFQAYNCDLQENLDLTLLKVRRYFTVYGNSDLMSIDLPTLVQNNNYHIAGRFHDCSLNQTTVDGILSAYATLFQNITIGYNFTLSLEGGTNAVPTDGSLNVDISILEYEFSQSTRTLTLTYNT